MDSGPRSPDGYVEPRREERIVVDRARGYIGGSPDLPAIEALVRIRSAAADANEQVSYGLAGDELRALGVEL